MWKIKLTCVKSPQPPHTCSISLKCSGAFPGWSHVWMGAGINIVVNLYRHLLDCPSPHLSQLRHVMCEKVLKCFWMEHHVCILKICSDASKGIPVLCVHGNIRITDSAGDVISASCTGNRHLTNLFWSIESVSILWVLLPIENVKLRRCWRKTGNTGRKGRMTCHAQV